MKLKYSAFLLLLPMLLCFLSFAPAAAQIRGTVTDQVSRQPVIGASVYVNNTTYGCQSDVEGHFELQSFPPPPFRVVVSSIGYESATFEVKDRQMSGVAVTLKPKATGLGEIVVRAPEKNGWELYGKDFIADFIGYSAFAARCEILNTKDIEFRYDKNTARLRVSAQQPLKIKNKATGYLITYWLDDYEKDYLTKRLFYKGNVQFEALPSKKDKTNRQWQANREKAFKGSLNHFMRAVYNNTVYQDSFELRVYKKVAAKDYGRTVPFRTDPVPADNDTLVRQALRDYLHLGDSSVQLLDNTLSRWRQPAATYRFSLEAQPTDTAQQANRKLVFDYNPENPAEKRIAYYDYQYIPVDSAYERMKSRITIKDSAGVVIPLPKNPLPETISYLWTQKMPLDSFVARTTGQQVMLRFNDYIQVTYLGEKEESEYLNGQFPRTHVIPEQQQSLISLENREGVRVMPDGNFFEAYDLMLEEYWSYEKLDKMLPLDYQP